MKNALGLILFITLFSLFSCDSEPAKPIIDSLEDGRYEIVQTLRNGKVTKQLDNAFYEIEGKMVRTNLTKTLDSLSSEFRLQKSTIKHTNAEVFDFDVVKNINDTLELNMQRGNFTFEMILVKRDTIDE